ncbi:hypothetical protein MMC10_002491 [Thelotrema lepadinum]|nr:hypothetical protein [Thelotrema lepadinum]
MIYRQTQSSRSTYIDQTFPPVPPIPSTANASRRPSNVSLGRPSSKGSINTVSSNKSRARGVRPRHPTISTPSDFRRLEGAMEGTQSSGFGAEMSESAISKPSATLASPFRPLELQIHMDGRCMSPMPNFSRPPSMRPGLPPRSSSLPGPESRHRSLSAPIPVRSPLLPEVYQKPSPTVQQNAQRSRSAPMSRLEAEIYNLDDASEAADHLDDDFDPDVSNEREAAVRSQSFYADKGAILLASTLDVPPPVPLKIRSKSPSPAITPSKNFSQERQPQQQRQQQKQQPQKTSTPLARDLYQSTTKHTSLAHRSRSLGSMPKISTKSPTPPKIPSLGSSPVEMIAEDECLRFHAQRNAFQSRLSNSQLSFPKSSSKVRRSLEPKSPASLNSESRSRSNSTAKTFTTATESKRDSTGSFESIASETSFSSLNSGIITNEKFIRTKNTDFELLTPPGRIGLNRISAAASAPVPVSTLTDFPPLPTPVPRAHVRPTLTTSRSTEWFASSTASRPAMAKRSMTMHESQGLSPGLERLGTMGYGQIVKGSPRLVTVGAEKIERKNSEPKVEWGKGLGVEWGVVY